MINSPVICNGRPNFKFLKLVNPIDRDIIRPTVEQYFMAFPGFKGSSRYFLHNFCEIKILKKNEFYFRDHRDRKEICFIIRGGVKLYRDIGEKQHVVNLFKEGYWGDMKSYISVKCPDIYHAICVENTILATISDSKLKQLLVKHPEFVDFFNELNEDIFLSIKNRMTSFQILSAQERYEDLLNNDPELLNLFKLNDIANYLGIRPETLSRLRYITSHKRCYSEQHN